MQSSKRTLILTLLLGVALLLAGCTSVINDDSSNEIEGVDELDSSDVEEVNNVDVEQLRTDTVETSKEVETATVNMEMQMDFDSGESATMKANSQVDQSAEKLYMDMKMDIQSESREMEQYIDGETAYVKIDGEWKQTEVPNTWDQSRYEQQSELLQSASETELLGKTTIDGEELYVMEIDVDEEALMEVVAQQGTAGPSTVSSSADLTDVTVTQYVDTETNYVQYAKMEMDMSTMGERASMTMKMEYEDINEPVDITIPEDARNAPEIGTTL